MQGILAILIVIAMVLVGLAIGALMVAAKELVNEADRLRVYDMESRRESYRLSNRVLQINDYIGLLSNTLLTLAGILVVGMVIGIATAIAIAVVVLSVYYAGKKFINYAGKILSLKVLNKHKEMEEKRNEKQDKYTIM